MKAGTATALHRGGPSMGSLLQIALPVLCVGPGVPERRCLPRIEELTTPMKPARGSSSDRVLVVDVNRPFISGRATVAIIHDNRPVFRPFDCSLMRVRVLLPQPEMAEDARYYVRFMDEA
jgi:hypothetical protein